MGNRGIDKSELFWLIPKSTANKSYTLYTYQQFFLIVKVFKRLFNPFSLPVTLRGRTDILVSFSTRRDGDAEKVYNELAATKLL